VLTSERSAADHERAISHRSRALIVAARATDLREIAERQCEFQHPEVGRDAQWRGVKRLPTEPQGVPGEPLGVSMALLREGETAEVVVDGGGPRRAQPAGPPEAVERVVVRSPGLVQVAAQPQRDSGLVVQRAHQQPATASARLGVDAIEALPGTRCRLVVAPGERGAARLSRVAIGRQAAVAGLVDQLQRTAPQPFGSAPVPTDQRNRGGHVQDGRDAQPETVLDAHGGRRASARCPAQQLGVLWLTARVRLRGGERREDERGRGGDEQVLEHGLHRSRASSWRA